MEEKPGKPPPPAANKEGARGRHGASPGQGGKKGGQQENTGGVTLGVRGDDGVREASRVENESPRVGDEEGGRKASGVAENPGGGRHGVGGGVESPQGADTPRVTEETRGDKTPGVPTATEVGPGEDGRGWGEGDKNPPTAQSTRTPGGDGGNSGDGGDGGDNGDGGMMGS